MSEPINMLALRPGDVWETATGKRFDVLDRAFFWGGKRWVAMFDRHYKALRVISIAWLESQASRRVEC